MKKMYASRGCSFSSYCMPLTFALLSLLLVNICLQQAAASAVLYGSNNNNHNKGIESKAAHVDSIFPAINEFSAQTVIRPEVLHGRHKRAIKSTLDARDGLHTPYITLAYLHEGQRVQIDLKRNDRLLPDEHFLRYQNSNTTQGHVVLNFTKTEIDSCHYQGKIRGKPNSQVAISTCDGSITGIVFDGEQVNFIQPHEISNGRLNDEHYLLRQADMLDTNATCGYNHIKDDHSHGAQTHAAAAAKAQHLDGNELKRMLRFKRSSDDRNELHGPYNANKHSSYVELVIVVDNKVYKHFDENAKKVHHHCKALANIVNALYVPLNIFVALVGVVIWNEKNDIEFSSDGDVTLRNFLNYRSNNLVLQHPNDNAQLLTKEVFAGGVVGKALKGPICTYEYSGGVSMLHSQIIAVVATTMAHEMGHNFGMEHDSSDCKCQDEKCIMAASSTAVVPVHWSSCSIDQLNIAFSRGMNYCLRNKPNELFDSPQCGNGFVEAGEQCDCGLPEFCANSCCDPYTCKLHSNATCATGACCDLNTCQPKIGGSTCRLAENECDLPEYCTGESEYCPGDVFKRDTEECDNGEAYCFQGQCRSHSNQCRILWGPTGNNSENCYHKNKEGNRMGNCGYNRQNKSFVRCESEHVACGMLHCQHLNERLEFGMESAAMLSNSYVNHKGRIVACRTALVDLGLQSTDPGLVPNGAKCGNGSMCVNQKCLKLQRVREIGLGAKCPDDCSGNGVCNSRGNCHCDIGYAGESCRLPGPGGSVDSGPATDPNSHAALQRFLYIFFFGLLPCAALFVYFIYYCRNHKFFMCGKLAENIIKTSSGTKQPPPRMQNGGMSGHGGGGGVGGTVMTKSTPSSTDDMNSALLKSPSDGSDGLFGQFKGFSLRPLNDATSPTNNFNAPNVAFVQPTVQEAGVPQRLAPPPPKVKNDTLKINGTLPRKAPTVAPALPPPNPGSTARPIISMPVLEASTLAMRSGEISPMRTAPPLPTDGASTLKPAPPPPVPLHADPKLNIKRDGTIRRIASFLKKEDKPPIKEKTYIERDVLRTLEISAPMPVTAHTESSNSDSETISPREEETKNLVKRAQSMRSPTRKTNVQSFGSMRAPPGSARPKSGASNAAAARPKSPPPRPPPVTLKKTNSTTSSGYQMPIATAKSKLESTYDDCEFVELPLAKPARGSGSNDDIYSVIDEIPPASQTLKRSDLVSIASNSSGEMGLLGEIVNEIEKRNGDSIYKASTLSTSSKPQDTIAPIKKLPKEPKSPQRPAPPKPKTEKSNAEKVTSSAATKSATVATPTATYLRPAPVNAPVARVAPTRSDTTPTSTFSSFRPPPAGSSTKANKTPTTSTTNTTKTSTNAAVAAATRSKSFTKQTASTTKTLPSGAATAPSATIQKPKPLSAKPSFSSQKRGPGAHNSTSSTTTGGTATGNATRVTPTPPTVKSSNIASLTQRFEKAGSGAVAATTAKK